MGNEVDAFLNHHGVKGMRWGQRRTIKMGGGKDVPSRKVKRADKKFEKKATDVGTFIKVHNAGAEHYNKVELKRINNKAEYKNADFRRASPLRDKYYAEHQKAFLDSVEKAAQALGTNASGTKQYGIIEGDNGNWALTVTDVKHSADTPTIELIVHKDYLGHIINISEKNEVMQTSMDRVSYLCHVGEEWLYNTILKTEE